MATIGPSHLWRSRLHARWARSITILVPIWHLDSTEDLQLWEGVASTRVECHWVECFLIFDGGLYGITLFVKKDGHQKKTQKKGPRRFSFIFGYIYIYLKFGIGKVIQLRGFYEF